MTQLYVLADEYLVLTRMIDDGEISEGDFVVALDQLKGEIADKAQNIGLLVKSTEATMKAINEEVSRLNMRVQVRQNRIEALKMYLKHHMAMLNETKIETPLVTVSIQKNPASIEVVDEAAIEARFLRLIPETYVPMKTEAKAEWKDKGVVPVGFAIVEDRTRLAIK